MISVCFWLSLQDLVQESLQNKKNNNRASNTKTDQKHIYLYSDLPFLNLLRAALHHTRATPNAKLAFTSISLTPEVAKPR